MLTQHVSYEEIISFQNEYIQIQSYFKHFMTAVMKRIRVSNGMLNQQKIDRELIINKIEEYIKRIAQQKKALFNELLN